QEITGRAADAVRGAARVAVIRPAAKIRASFAPMPGRAYPATSSSSDAVPSAQASSCCSTACSAGGSVSYHASSFAANPATSASLIGASAGASRPVWILIVVFLSSPSPCHQAPGDPVLGFAVRLLAG